MRLLTHTTVGERGRWVHKMDVILLINGRVFSPRLSTYSVEQEISYAKVITTADGTEHSSPPKFRDIVRFSLFPFNDEEANKDYIALSAPFLMVSYTDPSVDRGIKEFRKMRLDSNLNRIFGLRSIDGNRYYKGGEIVLRAVNTEDEVSYAKNISPL